MKTFLELKHAIIDAGLDTYPKIYIYGEIAAVFLLYALALIIHPEFPIVSLTVASAAGITLVWWIHNSGHDSFFSNKKYSEIWIECLGLLFLGMPQIEYHYDVHRKHHGSTNVIGKDGALSTGPIRWHKKMYDSQNPKVLKYQAWLWLFFVLPLTWPILTLLCVKSMVQNKAYLRIVAFAGRWAFAVCFLDASLVFIPPLVTGFVLGFTASLNHFPMPIDDKAAAPFPASVFITTQNLSHKNYFMTWLTGGLNFHIEHHLFPKLPSWRLRQISALVRRYARANGLPYHECSLPRATHRLYMRLKDPINS